MAAVAEHQAGAGLVLDDHRLAQHLRELLAVEPRERSMPVPAASGTMIVTGLDG